MRAWRKGAACLGTLVLAVSAAGEEPDDRVTRWVAQLASRAAADREEAARGLSSVGPEAREAVPLLRRALEDDDRLVRLAAAYALGRVGLEARGAAEGLARIVTRDGDPLLRLEAAVALARITRADEALGVFKTALRNPDSQVRRRGAYAYATLGFAAAGAVAELKAALKDPDAVVRGHAARALAGLGSRAQPAVQDLEAALQDPSLSVRDWARHALVEVAAGGDPARDVVVGPVSGEPAAAVVAEEPVPESVPIPLLKTSPPAFPVPPTGGRPDPPRPADGADSSPQEDAVSPGAAPASGAGEGAVGSVGTLRAGLESPDGGLRRHSAQGLGRLGADAEDAVPELLEALEDRDSLVRMVAASALGAIGSPEAVPRLRKALGDADTGVVVQAALALAKLGYLDEALPALEAARRSPDRMVHKAAVRALGTLGQQRASPTSVPVTAPAEAAEASETPAEAPEPPEAPALEPGTVSTLKRMLESGEAKDRRRAAYALTKLGPRAREALPELRAALGDPESLVRMAAARALGSLGASARGAVPALEKALGTDDGILRVETALALSKIAGPSEKTLAVLRQALRSRSGGVRRHAARALGEIGPAASSAIADLRAAQKDSEESVRRAATSALEKVEGH